MDDRRQWEADLRQSPRPWLDLGQARGAIQQAYGPLEASYQAVLGRAIDSSGFATYGGILANGGAIADVRAAIAYSPEAQSRLEAAYHAVWGRPIDQDYLEYYTFPLGTPDWTLAAIVQDEKERYLQTVVLPVLIAVSVLQ